MILSIIIPCYNEENTIFKIVNKIKDIKLRDIKKEIIIVDDGSTDRTTEIIKKLDGVISIYHQKNQGKGKAINTALQKCTGDLILIQDADLEYDPSDYKDLIKPFVTNDIHVVYGSRRLKNNNYSYFSFFIGGLIITSFANLLYPNAHLTDLHTCYKIFRKNLIKNINLDSKGFEFCPEITAKILNKKIFIKEIPISYYPRNKKEGKKIKWKDGLIAIYTLIKYRFIKNE